MLMRHAMAAAMRLLVGITVAFASTPQEFQISLQLGGIEAQG